MSKIIDKHECLYIPKSFKILKTVTANKWVIAKEEDGYGSYCETIVWKIKYCPYCGDKLDK